MTHEMSERIERADVRWLLCTLGGGTDAQLRSALEAGGASGSEVAGYGRAARARIEGLRAVSGDRRLLAGGDDARRSRRA